MARTKRNAIGSQSRKVKDRHTPLTRHLGIWQSTWHDNRHVDDLDPHIMKDLGLDRK